MNALLSLMIAVTLVGCVPFPTYKTLQPSASMTVLDQAGKPVGGANVELINSSYPYGRERFRTTGQTQPDGTIAFTKVTEWRVEMPFMIHGMEVFFWNWCVSKEGYQTVQTRYANSNEFSPEALLTLSPGNATTCSGMDRRAGPT